MGRSAADSRQSRCRHLAPELQHSSVIRQESASSRCVAHQIPTSGGHLLSLSVDGLVLTGKESNGYSDGCV
jgi:hypothetical protein